MSALQLHLLLSHNLIILQVNLQHTHTQTFHTNVCICTYTYTHRHYSMDALIHTQYEDTYDLMPEDMQGPSMLPAPLTNSNPQSAVCHTCMLQCSCTCFIQACHVQTCMICVFFFTMHKWVTHLHTCPPPFHQCISVCLHSRGLT